MPITKNMLLHIVHNIEIKNCDCYHLEPPYGIINLDSEFLGNNR